MVVQSQQAYGYKVVYPAPQFLDLKHYSLKQWGLKDPPQCNPFWLLNRNVLSGRCSACLYTRESLSMLIGQPTNQWSGTQLPEHITPCLLVSKSKCYCGCGAAESAGRSSVWQGSLTCNFIPTGTTLVRGKKWVHWLLLVEKDISKGVCSYLLILSCTNSKISIPWHSIHLNLLYVVSMENLFAQELCGHSNCHKPQ